MCGVICGLDWTCLLATHWYRAPLEVHRCSDSVTAYSGRIRTARTRILSSSGLEPLRYFALTDLFAQKVVPGGFEPPSMAPKAIMIGHYTTGLHLLVGGPLKSAFRELLTTRDALAVFGISTERT